MKHAIKLFLHCLPDATRDYVIGAGYAFDPLPQRPRKPTFHTNDRAALAEDAAKMQADLLKAVAEALVQSRTDPPHASGPAPFERASRRALRGRAKHHEPA